MRSGFAGPATFPPHLVSALILAARPRSPMQPAMGTLTPPLRSEGGALISGIRVTLVQDGLASAAGHSRGLYEEGWESSSLGSLSPPVSWRVVVKAGTSSYVDIRGKPP